MKAKYFDATDAGKLIGCDRRTVCRIAKNLDVGIFIKGRLVAINTTDLDAVKRSVQKGPGNPQWIAMGRTKSSKKRSIAAS